MTGPLRGPQALPARGLALVVLVCAAAGLISGVSPKYGVAVAAGLGFVATIFANLTVGVALFIVLSFLGLLSAGGAAVSFIKVAGVLLLMSWLFTRSADGRTGLGSVAERHPAGASAALRAAHIFERLSDRDMEVVARCALLALIALLASDFFVSDLGAKQLWIVVGLCLALVGVARGQALPMREPSP